MKLRPLFAFLLLLMFPETELSAAEHLRIAAPRAMPPYILSDSDSGIELDILRDALAPLGYLLTPVYADFAEVPNYLRDKKVDGAVVVSETLGLQDVCYTTSPVSYQNVAVTLASRHKSIQTISDLADNSIAAFQNASKVLGPEYAVIAKEKSPGYKEIANQELQLALLFQNSSDVIILDRNIFRYYLQRLQQSHTSVDATQPVTIHTIFPKTSYKTSFRRPELCEAFDRQFAGMKKSGEYQKILNKYIAQ